MVQIWAVLANILTRYEICHYSLWFFLKDAVYTIKQLQQEILAALISASELTVAAVM
jgi:hypothetical protein